MVSGRRVRWHARDGDGHHPQPGLPVAPAAPALRVDHQSARGPASEPYFPRRRPRPLHELQPQPAHLGEALFIDHKLTALPDNVRHLQPCLLQLFHGMDETVPMKSLNYTLTPGTKFESTSNTLVIVLYSMVSTSNRGFIIDYDTSKPTRKYFDAVRNILPAFIPSIFLKLNIKTRFYTF